MTFLSHPNRRRGLHHILESEQFLMEMADSTASVGLCLCLILFIRHVQLCLLGRIIQGSVLVSTVCRASHDAYSTRCG